MKSDLIAAYAKLTTLNTYEGNPDKINTLYDVDIENDKSKKIFKFKLINKFESDNDTGYQGYTYKNMANGDIIIVHEGSIPTNQIFAHFSEVDKDWRKANVDTLMGRVNSQFEPAKNYVDTIRAKYPNHQIIMIGQSLGGTLCELVGALERNKDIKIYTFNSFGAGHLLNNLKTMDEELSNDYSNIYNFTYSNEIPTRINPHIGNIFKSDYIVSQSEDTYFHSIEAHYKNALDYELDNNYPAILKYDGAANMVKFAITNSIPAISLVSSIAQEMKEIENFVNALRDIPTFKLQVSITDILYNVEKGDTIWNICKTYGLSYEDIIKENPWLKDRFSRDKSFALIKPDEQIKIPSLHPKSKKSQPDTDTYNHESKGIINPMPRDYRDENFSFEDIRPIAWAEVPFIHKSKYENEVMREIKKHKDFMRNPHEATGDLFEQRLIHALDDFCLMKGYTIHDYSGENVY